MPLGSFRARSKSGGYQSFYSGSISCRILRADLAVSASAYGLFLLARENVPGAFEETGKDSELLVGHDDAVCSCVITAGRFAGPKPLRTGCHAHHAPNTSGPSQTGYISNMEVFAG